MSHPSCVGPGSLEQLWMLCRAAGGIQLNGWGFSLRIWGSEQTPLQL